MMKLHPVKRYHAPSYATRAAIDADSTLLRQVPKRWQTNAAVLAALAGVGLLAAPGLLTAAGDRVESPVVARVAPIFPYQDPHRAMIEGKIAVPRFLTEAEARQIITEEAQKAGITFDAERQVLPAVSLNGSNIGKDGKRTVAPTKVAVTLDGTDVTRHIGYEFISHSDLEAWRAQGVTLVGDPSPAVAFRDGLTQGIPAGTYAVFYDPAMMPFTGEDLRQQVRDFLAWLKAEQVI